MKILKRMRVLALATPVAIALALLGMGPVSACVPAGTLSCPSLPPPPSAQNGLPLILAVDAGGVVVLGVLLLMVVLFIKKRRNRLGRAEQLMRQNEIAREKEKSR